MDKTADEVRQIVDKIISEWSDKGMIIEGGWQAYVYMSGMPEEARHVGRQIYFLAAQHLFASIMSFVDSGREPTLRDMQRMTLVYEELEKFRKSMGN